MQTLSNRVPEATATTAGAGPIDPRGAVHAPDLAAVQFRAWAGRAMWAGVATLSALSLAWVALGLVRGVGLTHESGVMTGLAMHLAAGVFYPPLVGPTGYGGTRYGPVLVLLQGGLIHLGLPPVRAGQLLSLAAAAALGGGMVRLLRQHNVRLRLAASFPGLLFLGSATIYALTGIRPDLLPAALNVWGLVCVGRMLAPRIGTPRNDNAWIAPGLLAAVLFGLAIVTKMSAGFGVVTAGLVLLLNRRVRPGGVVVTATAILSIVGLIALNDASNGRLWENFRACADPSGRPSMGLRGWGAILGEVFLRDDWAGTALLVIALLAWAAAPLRMKRSTPGVYLLVTLPLTLLMFLSPGLSANHLIDVQVAAVLFLALFLNDGVTARPMLHGATMAAIAVTVLLATLDLARPRNLSKARYDRIGAFRRAVATATDTPVARLASCGPVLSDNAMVPVVAGQVPFLLDDFMFPAVRHVRPAAKADLYDRLDRRYFTGVVLRYDPATGDRPFALGQQFAAHLRANYDLVARTTTWDKLWIYRPKPSRPTPPPQQP